MEGNFIRKFFIATVVLKLLSTDRILKQWPNIIEDVIIQSGSMSVPFAMECAGVLFEKLYQ